MQKGKKSRYIMIGGFLGAGKTTAIIQLAKRLTGQSARVGLISNDQSTGLVDTRMMLKHGFPVEEIAGGCFCCKFNSLSEATRRLTESESPEYFIAEPVGSCTDLVASVSYPLRRIYGENYTIAPLSVLVDPIRACRILGLDEGRHFSSKVVYVYRKQLEEAEIIVINKSELLTSDRLRELKEALEREFQPRRVLSVSARSGEGLEEWFNLMASEECWAKNTMELDYDLYAEGEALLGWLNATVQVTSPQEVDGNQLISSLARNIQNRLTSVNFEVAHLKMTLTPDVGLGDIASINLVRNDFVPELSERLEERMTSGSLIINLRAEGDSEILKSITEAALHEVAMNTQVSLILDHIEFFQPAKPSPTYRMATPLE